MSWSRVADPVTLFKAGDSITVKVLRVDEATGKIALGLKQLQDDPWAKVPANYAIGQVSSGRVTRTAEFGAFIELEPGIEALAHVSTFPPTGRKDAWTASVAPGTTVAVEIVSVDPEKKRIGVKVLRDAQETDDLREYAEREETNAAQGLGSMADKLRGALSPRDK
jgi:small subunit ribosomal protein S1